MGLSFEKVRSNIHVAPLLTQVSENPYLFKEFLQRQQYPGTAHSETETIYIRWAPEFTYESIFDSLDSVDYAAIEQLDSVKKIIVDVMLAVHAKDLGRVIITKLEPGGFIDPHVDEGKYAGHFERFHIPLYAKDGCVFFVENNRGEGEFANMREGELWWFNHQKKHWVVNSSQEPRVHLIIDAVSPLYKERIHGKGSH